MILTRDKNHGNYEIKSYEPGAIKINDTIYDHSLLVGLDTLEAWPPKNIQEFQPEHLSVILKLKPDFVLLGTGEQSIFLDPKLLRTLYEHHVSVEVMKTLSACHTFNVMMSEARNVVAALIIR